MGEGTGVTNTEIVGLRCLIGVIVENGERLENLGYVSSLFWCMHTLRSFVDCDRVIILLSACIRDR